MKFITLILVLFSCPAAQINLSKLGLVKQDTQFKEAEVSKINLQESISYKSDIKPILDNRCVVCHSCYDSPCQLKLSSPAGIQRGASKDKVYDGSRLLTIKPTRLDIDAASVKGWRKKDFFPVISEEAKSHHERLNDSSLARMLKLKQLVPLPSTRKLPSSLNFTLGNAQYCAKSENFEGYANFSPYGGMPYALPALKNSESNKIYKWILDGAKIDLNTSLTEQEKKNIAMWELFLNKSDMKSILVSRYIYEHLYLASLHFSKESKRFFKLVRSKTPSGKRVERIVTRRPFDDPEQKRVYYRLIPQTTTVVSKNHMPYYFGNERMDWYKELFFSTPYKVTKLPSYRPQVASNPFATFKELPIQSRYRFILEEAMYTISGFIKGPVCRGQIALSVIQDHFWTFFVDPDIYKDSLEFPTYENLENLTLPAATVKRGGVQWYKYKKKEEKYLNAKSKYLNKHSKYLTISSLWDGGKKNPNAALTIFRHFDSATVAKGLIGEEPKTAWVIGYPLLERIHYLLVAGFDVYGDVSHQLTTRLYMDFLRLEGEFGFLALLPKKTREKERDLWYANASKSVKQHLLSRLSVDTKVRYTTNNHKTELFSKLKDHLGKSIDQFHTSNNEELNKLNKLKGKPAFLLPQVSYLRVLDGDDFNIYSIIHNNAHYNITHLLNEGSQRVSSQDTLNVAKGLIGTYPNMIFNVEKSELKNFVKNVSKLKNENDYARLLDNYGLRRNSKNFWPVIDSIHKSYHSIDGVEYGLMDLNRYENK